MESSDLMLGKLNLNCPSPRARAFLAGGLAASLLLYALLHTFKSTGEQAPPSLSTMRFSVAVLQGPKQAAQEAPANVDKTAPDVVAEPPKERVNKVVSAERETSLPKAVAAAQDTTVGPEAAKPDEVIPPAQVSMPGGKLMAQDASVGEQPDPFAVGPRQVYIRIYVDANGNAKRGGIVRQGAEPMRDALILKAMMSRSYSIDKLMKAPGEEQMWQLDLVIDYGTNEFLP
ncbi:DNA ligase [Novimethylophilus kurashikiensis]|uniref:DNA ligase n=1 Tax=Novimethylophilus kurashikiensis TaxID=1825523 RepID=A0A2R5FCM6_9PROT|nr:hypothetical protein [Novimethylophilus kurashikiensis]GBG14394.1 DNA ligase [Novimethylophilus kurashikiensis]